MIISVPSFTDMAESVPINSLLKPFGKSQDSDSSVRVYFKPLMVMPFATGHRLRLKAPTQKAVEPA